MHLKNFDGNHSEKTISEGAEMDTQAMHKIDYSKLIQQLNADQSTAVAHSKKQSSVCEPAPEQLVYQNNSDMGQSMKRQKTADDNSYKARKKPKSTKLGSSKTGHSESDLEIEPVQSQQDGKDDDEESEGRK